MNNEKVKCAYFINKEERKGKTCGKACYAVKGEEDRCAIHKSKYLSKKSQLVHEDKKGKYITKDDKLSNLEKKCEMLENQ